MADINDSVTQNLLPVQAYFNLDGSFNTFIGQGQPFYASINPVQSGLTITNSTIDSTTIGATNPSTGVFTNVSGTTGQISTTPSSNTDIANKFYVDTVAQGLGPKAACAVATTANITLSGLQTIDGYTTLAGDRVLVKNQSSSQYNGIYIASASTWTRAVDMDVWSEVPGAYTVVLNGGQADTGWVCTATQTGTINVTAMPWVQFSGSATYFAGTGLTLASNTFSITNVGTAGTYGSASAVPVFVTNAQGQVTSVTNTSIAIANTQVSGLGTMSTQNANNVSITGGSITGTPISGSTVGGTTITASTQFSGPGTGLTGTASGLSIGGNAATATSATTAGSVTNSVTFNNSGTGAASGTTFNGSVAQTISYNTIGAPSTTGTGASGTWAISISGNAATVTNGVYTTGSYSNPSWITSISGSIVSGAVASATTATNVAGGLAGSLPYQSGAGATTFLGIGSANYVLTSNGTAPQYVAQSTLSVGSASTATTSTNLAGGVAGAIPYQSGASTTAFSAAGTSGQVLTSGGTGAPTWTTPTAYATVTDDTTTNGTRYPLFANQTSGNLSTEYTSSTKLQFNPSTGLFTTTALALSISALTSSNTSNLSIGGNLGFSDTGIISNQVGTTNSYLQAVLQNKSNNASASAEYIVYNDQGTAATNFATFGINSSAYSGTGSINAPGYGYFLSGSTDIVIGTIGANNIHLTTNSQATDAVTINTSNSVAFNGSYGTSGYLLQTNGNASAPTWVAQSTITAGTATNANNVAVTDNTSTNATYYPVFVSTSSGNQAITTASTKLKFNPSTGALTASTIYIAP